MVKTHLNLNISKLIPYLSVMGRFMAQLEYSSVIVLNIFEIKVKIRWLWHLNNNYQTAISQKYFQWFKL